MGLAIGDSTADGDLPSVDVTDVAVRRYCELQCHERSSAPHTREETLYPDITAETCVNGDPDALQAKPLDTLAIHPMIRVTCADNDPSNACACQRIGTGWCTTMVGAWLKRDVGSCALRQWTGLVQSDPLCVRPAAKGCHTAPNDAPIANDQAADGWIFGRKSRVSQCKAAGSVKIASVFLA